MTYQKIGVRFVLVMAFALVAGPLHAQAPEANEPAEAAEPAPVAASQPGEPFEPRLPGADQIDDPLLRALAGGRFDLNIRFRYEFADIDGFDASHAGTMRTRLGSRPSASRAFRRRSSSKTAARSTTMPTTPPGFQTSTASGSNWSWGSDPGGWVAVRAWPRPAGRGRGGVGRRVRGEVIRCRRRGYTVQHDG